MENKAKPFLEVELTQTNIKSNDFTNDDAKSLSQSLSTAGSTKEVQIDDIKGTKENPNGISTLMAFF